MSPYKCPCGKWLSPDLRGEATHCADHSLNRSHRVIRDQFNANDGASYKHIPRTLKAANELGLYFDRVDSGCGIWCLDVRPDCGGIKHVSKKLFESSLDNGNHVKWGFFCHRMYDQPLNSHCVLPFILPKDSAPIEFSKGSVRLLQKEMKTYNKEASTAYYGDSSHYQEFARKQSNPSGLAGAHSGHTWLHDLLEKPGEFASYQKFCAEAARLLFKGNDGLPRATMLQLMGVQKVDGCKIGHTGAYYEMSMSRVGLHCLRVRSQHGGTHCNEAAHRGPRHRIRNEQFPIFPYLDVWICGNWSQTYYKI